MGNQRKYDLRRSAFFVNLGHWGILENSIVECISFVIAIKTAKIILTEIHKIYLIDL